MISSFCSSTYMYLALWVFNAAEAAIKGVWNEKKNSVHVVYNLLIARR